jgi:hypothetical protein
MKNRLQQELQDTKCLKIITNCLSDNTEELCEIAKRYKMFGIIGTSLETFITIIGMLSDRIYISGLSEEPIHTSPGGTLRQAQDKQAGSHSSTGPSTMLGARSGQATSAGSHREEE